MQQPTAETPGTGGATTHATGARETGAAAPLARGTGVEMREIARGVGIATPSTTRETEAAKREARATGGKLLVLQDCLVGCAYPFEGKKSGFVGFKVDTSHLTLDEQSVCRGLTVGLCCFASAGATVVLLYPWMAGGQEGGTLSEEEVRFVANSKYRSCLTLPPQRATMRTWFILVAYAMCSLQVAIW